MHTVFADKRKHRNNGGGGGEGGEGGEGGGGVSVGIVLFSASNNRGVPIVAGGSTQGRTPPHHAASRVRNRNPGKKL